MYCATKNIRDNKSIKYLLQETFTKSICFTSSGGIHENRTVFHAHQVNPVVYAIASTIRTGLGDEEITISFAKMMHRKMKAQQTRASLSISPENVFEELNKYDPIKEIFNAISLSDNPLIPRSKFDYAAPKS